MFEEWIEKLTEEHRVINRVLKDYEKNLDNLQKEDIENFLDFIQTTVENHAHREDEEFLAEVLKVMPDYDAQVFSFAHGTIREGVDHLNESLEEYLSGKSKIEDVRKYVKKIITLIYDHFLEEENFFFPEIKCIKVQNDKAIIEDIDLREEREWL